MECIGAWPYGDKEIVRASFEEILCQALLGLFRRSPIRRRS